MKKSYMIGHVLLVGAVCVASYKYLAGDARDGVRVRAASADAEILPSSPMSFREKSQALIDRTKEESDPELVPGENYWEMLAKPFEVVLSKEGFEWTREDGRHPKVARVLATNPAEYEALMEANQWTSRRELVYLPEDFDQKAEQVFNGQLKEFTIPFFEGELLTVKIDDVTPADAAIGAGPVSGSFTGAFQSGGEDIPVFLAASEGVWSIDFHQGGLDYRIENRGETNEVFISETDSLRRNIVLGVPPCDKGEHFATDNVGDVIAPYGGGS